MMSFRNINFFTFVIIILIFRLDSWRACATENIDMKPVSHVIIKPAQVETPPSPIFDPRKFGATGDGVTFDTAAIQKAIDACAGTGGSAFIGCTYVGDQAGENPSSTATVLGVLEQVSYYVPSRIIFNAGGSYAVGGYLFNLNIDNLLDTHTVWQSSGRNSMSGYPLINCRLTTTVKF